MSAKKATQTHVTQVKASRFLKRDIQPSFPHAMRMSKADSVLIIDFLTSQESSDYDKSFAAIVVNRDIALDLLKGIANYLGEGNIELEGMSIDIEKGNKD